jgi:hypothetical protein
LPLFDHHALNPSVLFHLATSDGSIRSNWCLKQGSTARFRDSKNSTDPTTRRFQRATCSKMILRAHPSHSLILIHVVTPCHILSKHSLSPNQQHRAETTTKRSLDLQRLPLPRLCPICPVYLRQGCIIPILASCSGCLRQLRDRESKPFGFLMQTKMSSGSSSDSDSEWTKERSPPKRMRKVLGSGEEERKSKQSSTFIHKVYGKIH